MKIHALICTRDKNLNPITKKLVSYLSSISINVKLLVGQESIFEGYKKGFAKCHPDPNDIFILCHDDIEIKMKPQHFIACLSRVLGKEVGFAGPAGTTFLGPNAVWWDEQPWRDGLHRGQVFHIKEEKEYSTDYGPFGPVVVLDGLFLAAKADVLSQIGLSKPDYFEGDWDFYDIHYTSEAFKSGLTNITVPIKMLHHSSGSLVGRDSWHKNREAFIANNTLPLTC